MRRAASMRRRTDPLHLIIRGTHSSPRVAACQRVAAAPQTAAAQAAGRPADAPKGAVSRAAAALPVVARDAAYSRPVSVADIPASVVDIRTAYSRMECCRG